MSTFINIKAIVKEQMRKLKDVKCCEISLNLYMLCTRRKPSLLMDFCRFENSGLDKACLNTVGDGASILKLDLDYFVFNKPILVSHRRFYSTWRKVRTLSYTWRIQSPGTFQLYSGFF